MAQKDSLSTSGGIINIDNIQLKILTIRGKQVITDMDLARLYEVETKVLNQAVKRNIKRFPQQFMFQLSNQEWEDLRSQIVTSNNIQGGRRYIPFVFTEQGVAMLSAILKSDIAIVMSIQIIKAFVQMRKFLIDNLSVFNRLDTIEYKQTHYQIETDKKLKKLFNALEDKTIRPKQGIFYDGQIFDAYRFIRKLIKSANKSIILIDNYIDEETLQFFSNRNKKTSCKIYTSKITNKLKLDLKKNNSQHEKIILHKFTKSH